MNSDWSTNTSNPMINTFIEVMIENVKYQDGPYVGIFFYNLAKDDFAKVISAHIKDLQFKEFDLIDEQVKTSNADLKTVYQRQFKFRRDPYFQSKYTDLLTGRVLMTENGDFVVLTGDWISGKSSTKNDILFEYQIPSDRTEFRIVDPEILH